MLQTIFNFLPKSQAKRNYPRTLLIWELVTDLLLDEKRLRREKVACVWKNSADQGPYRGININNPPLVKKYPGPNLEISTKY